MSSSKKDKEGGHPKFGGGFTAGETAIYRIPPYYYLHILDQSTNVTRVEIGPKTYVTKDTEIVVLGPEKMIVVPPCFYCIIKNPVARNDKGEILTDPMGQIKLRHADLDIRLEQEPFPLYPGEILHQDVTRLTVVPANSALRLKANRDFMDGTTQRYADDEWLFEGPGTYIPRKECEVVEKIRATIIQPNHALKLRARVETKDRDGKTRVAGEEWLVRKVGAYLPGAYEEIVDKVKAYVLTEKKALHVKAIRSFTDEWGKERKNGDEWLITLKDTETYIPGVDVTVESEVQIVTLSNRQYCVVLDPVDPATGKPQFGQKKLIKGEKSFFLMPGEQLEDHGIQDIYVLSENEGLILKAKEAFTDTSVTPAIQRKPGDRWMVRGPTELIPPLSTLVVTKRYAIPLDDNEGIYVRDIKTGKVRAVCGATYMLNQDEELWNKELPPSVESLLEKNALADRGFRSKIASEGVFGGHRLNTTTPDEHTGPHVRDKTRVVTYRVPHNGAVQLYDFKEKKSRVIFGPELVMLQPDEQFTELSLSGGRPKKPNEIRALCLLLGPDFCTDRVTVETADHARLQLQLAYNWHFEVDKKNPDEASRLFSVPDFVGDMCKAIASRIRGAVASVNFDDFHKNSARIIRESVFGFDENRKPRYSIKFTQNNLVVTSVDIQSVEPVDQRTRDALQKSVQLAIEITTSSQEATARHEAERAEQEAKGRLSRQKIEDEVKAEKSRLALLELQAQAMEVESCGQSKAESLGKAAAQKIEGEAAVEQAQLRAKATMIKEESDLEMLTKAREAELSYVKAQDELEVSKARELAEIEAKKFKELVDAIGKDTITAIAMAGPELQVKLLQGLGLQSTLITDGKTPLNLFSTALGFLGQKPAVQPRIPLPKTATTAAPDHEE